MTTPDPTCALCRPEDVVVADEHAYVARDKFSLSPGHVIAVPHRHVADFFAMTTQEKHAVLALLDRAREQIDRDHRPDGYNIGVNIGAAAGQSRMHVHVHLIPRYSGDVPDPSGGVRCVLPKRT
jgi:diadenosine tetraphosphate (Ap4A) HIT family hydrolase